MKFNSNYSGVLWLVVLVACGALTIARAFEDDALPFATDRFQSEEVSDAQTDKSFINKMYERGKLLFKSLRKTGVKLAGQVGSFIPTPETLFRVSKHALIGLPQELIAYTVNTVCSAAMHSKAIQPSITPSVHLMNFQLYTRTGESISIPLLEPHKLWNSRAFDRRLNTTLVVTGWNSNVNSSNEAIDSLHRAYRRQNVNFVVFDTADFIDSLYTWSAFNTEGVGKIVGAAIAEIGNEIDVNGIHLIGHSLGAHICGYAGRHYTNLTSVLLPRITGLDPARPCFNEGEQLNGLQRGDARFVDIIHSNAGILGIKESRGDVDFFPNGQYSLQPGCWTIMCAHSRSYEYFAESVNNGKHFIAAQCNSLSSLRNGRCTKRFVEMGLKTPHTVRGNFYLETNSKPPYGRSFKPYDSLLQHNQLVLLE